MAVKSCLEHLRMCYVIGIHLPLTMEYSIGLTIKNAAVTTVTVSDGKTLFLRIVICQ